jgi:hypothetical protein
MASPNFFPDESPHPQACFQMTGVPLMSTDFVEAYVHPNIPTQCLAKIETWILKRVFITKVKNDYVSFSGCWTLDDIYDNRLYPDDELTRALTDSHEICPDLCAAVEREFKKSGQIILGAVNYKKIFKCIVQRHPSHLSYVSICEDDENTRCGITRMSLTLITADAVETICTSSKKIVHRNETDQPFIFTRDE